MRRILYPDEYVESAYLIDFDRFYRKGYRGILFDIDNTLVAQGAPANEKAVALFSHLREIGFKCMVLSNNKEPRVKMFTDVVDVPYICRAHKPRPKNYCRAMQEMGTEERTTMFVGDQIFTDICGAKRAGIHAILVRPIDPHEEIRIMVKRIPERVVLFGYRIYRMRQERRGKSDA